MRELCGERVDDNIEAEVKQGEKDIIDFTLDNVDEPAEMPLKVLKRVPPIFFAHKFRFTSG